LIELGYHFYRSCTGRKKFTKDSSHSQEKNLPNKILPNIYYEMGKKTKRKSGGSIPCIDLVDELVSKQDFGNTKRGGYEAGKVDVFRDTEFYTVSGTLNEK
jgi:hypothetical protein